MQSAGWRATWSSSQHSVWPWVSPQAAVALPFIHLWFTHNNLIMCRVRPVQVKTVTLLFGWKQLCTRSCCFCYPLYTIHGTDAPRTFLCTISHLWRGLVDGHLKFRGRKYHLFSLLFPWVHRVHTIPVLLRWGKLDLLEGVPLLWFSITGDPTCH